jgi:hypothetical protein
LTGLQVDPYDHLAIFSQDGEDYIAVLDLRWVERALPKSNACGFVGGDL